MAKHLQMNPAEFNRCLKGISVGDRQSREEFFNTFYERMVYTAHRILKNWVAAEDVASEFVASILQKAGEIPYVKSPAAYICTSIRNRAKNYLRDNGKTVATEGYEIAEMLETYDALGVSQTIVELYNNLSPDEQDFVELHYLYGLNYKEIAKQFSIPEGTVKSRMHTLRTKIQSLDLSLEF